MKKSEKLGQTYRNGAAAAFMVGGSVPLVAWLVFKEEYSGLMFLFLTVIYGMAYPRIYKDGKKIGQWKSNSKKLAEFEASWVAYSIIGFVIGITVGSLIGYAL